MATFSLTTNSVTFAVTPTETSFNVQVGENTLAAANNATLATTKAAEAATSAGNATAAVARVLQPYLTPPSGASALVRLISLKLRTHSVDGVEIEWPANLSVRELAADSFNRLRFRLGGGDTPGGDGNYAQIGAESSNATAAGATSPGTLNRAYAGLTSADELLLYASDTSLGVAKGTVIGTYRIAFDGSTFGTYFPFTVFTAAAGLLVRSAVLPTGVEIANVTEIAKSTINQNARGPWFEPTLESTYVPSIIEDVSVEFGVPEKGRYVLNVRTDRGSGTQYRIVLQLYDTVRGAVVAQRARTENAPFNPGTMYLSGASNGSILTSAATSPYTFEWTGAHATVWFPEDFLDKVNWTFGVTTFTTAANAIKQDRILTTEQTGEMIRTGRGIRNHILVVDAGGDGDATTYKAAVDLLLDPKLAANPDDIQRGWWPLSQICTPSNQYEIRGKAGHTETKAAMIPSGVGFARGVLCWMGLTIRLPGASTFTAQAASGNSTYFFDYNLGGRIIAETDTLIVTTDSISVVHQDSGNALTKASAANANDPTAGQLFFKVFGVMQGGRYKSPIQAMNCGLSDGDDIEIRGLIFETTGAGQPNFSSHNSPANAFSGRYRFINVTTIGGAKRINLTNLDGGAAPVVARHRVEVSNCDVSEVVASFNNEGSPKCPWVRIGKQPGVTYSAAIEP